MRLSSFMMNASNPNGPDDQKYILALGSYAKVLDVAITYRQTGRSPR